jgi:hypothetical protein
VRGPGRRLALGAGCALLVAALAAAAAAFASGQLLSWGGHVTAEDRLVTGILVTGTAERPVVYVTSSDPRIFDDQIDTNSGVLSRLAWTGAKWVKVDLVRGLPRSKADHATNGIAISHDGRTLYLAQGSNTSMGALSEHFRDVPEYALSGAILAVDLERIGDRTYDLPTLDDESRPGAQDDNDPFGGQHGLNQARLVAGGPVQVYAPGFRNPYDVLLTSSGRMYTVQNGSNPGWGGLPRGEGPNGRCSHEPAGTDSGSYVPDTLQLVVRSGYGGHPNPTRGNPANTFGRDGQSPTPSTDPVECDFKRPDERRPIATFRASTNGLAEYTATGYRGARPGDLITVSLDGTVHRVRLDPHGKTGARADTILKLGVPLDITAQGDDAAFPGTLWVADYGPVFGDEDAGRIVVLEPGGDGSRPHWSPVSPSGLRRQEVSYVQLDGKLYLAGGDTRQQVYDPVTDTWRDVAPLPDRLDHIQGVALNGKIYYLGGLTAWPGPHASSVLVYDPTTDAFTRGRPMPRGRGAGGVAVHDGKLYYAGGLHDGVAVPWLDVYDPATDRWAELPDMPRARDHFQAVVIDSRLYAIGGRLVDLGSELDESDAFDLATGSWVTGLAPLPTPRGGFAAAAVGREILVVGGEVAHGALGTVEAYDVDADTWRDLPPLPGARHGIQAATCGDAVFIAAGGLLAGGGAPTDAHDALLGGRDRCGLPDAVTSGAPAFTHGVLSGADVVRPTSLQFGPDGRLYVAQRNGAIKVYTIVREGRGRYRVVAQETIDAIRSIANHDDDGSKAADFSRLIDAVRGKLGL